MEFVICVTSEEQIKITDGENLPREMTVPPDRDWYPTRRRYKGVHQGWIGLACQLSTPPPSTTTTTDILAWFVVFTKATGNSSTCVSHLSSARRTHLRVTNGRVHVWATNEHRRCEIVKHWLNSRCRPHRFKNILRKCSVPFRKYRRIYIYICLYYVPT
jgi:hypothetical protein